MTVCYPLTTQLDYTELRFSLRSIEKFLSPPFEVVIIGNRMPEWINNVTQIQLPDVPGRIQISVRRKIYAALEYAEEILFFNDDMYLLKNFDIHYYFHGDLKTYNYGGSKQLQTELKAMGKPTKNFDLHYPIVFKQDFKQIMEHFSADTLIRSAYCNYLGIDGVQMPDCKFIKETKPDFIQAALKRRPCFSTGVFSLKSVLPVLQELYPNKSKFELW